jgi:hypothetical protein
VIFIFHDSSYTDNGATITVNGGALGAAGLKHGTGTDGGVGIVGAAGVKYKVDLTTNIWTVL